MTRNQKISISFFIALLILVFVRISLSAYLWNKADGMFILLRGDDMVRALQGFYAIKQFYILAPFSVFVPLIYGQALKLYPDPFLIPSIINCIFGLGGVLVLFFLARKLFWSNALGRNMVGLLSVGLVIFYPAFIWATLSADRHSVFFFLIFIGLFFWINYLKSRKRVWLLPTAVAFLFSTATMHEGWIYTFVFTIFMLKDAFITYKNTKKIDFVRSKFGICAFKTKNELVEKSNVIILAVKPQDVDAILQKITVPLKRKLIISICAGITTKRLENRLGKVSIVRVMPNTPAKILQGISAVALGRYATERDKKLAVSIFASVGEVVELEERLMNAVTAISGSGPAFISYIIESMAQGAVKQGLPDDVAERLAIQTALGTGKLLRDMKLSPKEIISAVSSPGGTTIAGRQILESSDVKDILVEAIAAATERGRELAGVKSYKSETSN